MRELPFIEETICPAPKIVVTIKSSDSYPKPKSQPGDLAWLPISKLEVEQAYQRNINAPRVRRIARGWDWDRIKPLTVALRDKGYFVVDGQNTLSAALLRSDIPCLPCYIIMTVDDVVGEASSFLGINTERGSVTSLDRHKAALIAKDEAAICIDKTVTEQGFAIGPNSDDPCEIQAVSAVYNIYKRYDFLCLANTLRFINLSWGPNKLAKQSLMLTGIALFLKRVQTLSAEFEGIEYNVQKLAERVGRSEMEEIYQQVNQLKAMNTAKGIGIPGVVSSVLATTYDKRSKDKTKLSRLFMSFQDDEAGDEDDS